MSKEAENLMAAMKELQTLRARVGELEHRVEFIHPWRVRDLETMIQNEHKLYADAHERMLKAEARVKELEASIARSGKRLSIEELNTLWQASGRNVERFADVFESHLRAILEVEAKGG